MGPTAQRRLVARFPNLAGRAFWTVLDFVLPPECVHCRQTGDVFCDDCRTTVHYIRQPICQRCGCPTSSSGVRQCSNCLDNKIALDGLRSVAHYSGALRSAIQSFKYKRNRALLHRLGETMIRAWPSELPADGVLVPVPLARQRQRERGFNQAELLARFVGRELGIPVRPRALRRIRETTPQVGLGAVERRVNTAGAFRANPRETRQRPLILVDDVCTTGSTLSACAFALRAEGAPAVWAVTLARAGAGYSDS